MLCVVGTADVLDAGSKADDVPQHATADACRSPAFSFQWNID